MPAESLTALESDDSEIVVTFVHGTWGRGIFPALRTAKRPFWFEPGGAFRDKLLSGLQSRGTICSFDIFLWSGANSISHRDEAAKQLAYQLTNNVKRRPGIRQVIVAHSHGGNVTARALGYLDINVSGLRVCYLATPFMQLFSRTVGRSERFILAAAATVFIFIISRILFIILYPLFHVYIYGSVGENNERWFSVVALLSVLAGREVYLWRTSERSQARNEKLIQATLNPRHDQSHGDALILRAIDDEASLALAFGTIASLLSARLMVMSTLLLLALQAFDAAALLSISGYKYSDTYFANAEFLGVVISIAVVASLLALASRGVFGRELIYYPPGT